MNELTPFRPPGGLQRKVERQLTEITVDTGLRQARIQAQTEIESARLSATAMVAQRAMQEVAMLTKMENELSASVPSAQARILGLGEMAAIAMGGIVMNAARRF